MVPSNIPDVLCSAGARASVYAATSMEAGTVAAATEGYLGPATKPDHSSKLAEDPSTAQWLWEWSAAAVELPSSWDLPAHAKAA
jgi:hypothetical protein